MSYANGTTHYNLPQTVGTDKRDWFDSNEAFAAIDAALYTAATGQAADAEAISTINSKLAADEAGIAALQTKGNTHDSQIAALQTTVNSQTTQIQDVRQDAEDMITANNEGAAATSTRAYAVGDYFIYNDVLYKATAAIAIGDTIVPNTNCEATNVDTEISQINSDLGQRKIITTVSGNATTTMSALVNSIYADTKALADAGKDFLIEIDGPGWGYLNCRYANRNADNTIFNTMATFFFSGNVINYGISLRASASKIEQNNPSAPTPYQDLSNAPSTDITLKLIEVI